MQATVKHRKPRLFGQFVQSISLQTFECYRGHLAEPKTVKKRYFAKKKKTKQHRTKKGDEKKTAKLICCGNARLDL